MPSFDWSSPAPDVPAPRTVQGATGRQGIQGPQGGQGLAGEQGLRGERGLQGEQGERGQDATIDLDALTAAVIAKLLVEGRSDPGEEPSPLDALARALGPIHVQRIDRDTNDEKIVPVYLGGGFTIFSTDPK